MKEADYMWIRRSLIGTKCEGCKPVVLTDLSITNMAVYLCSSQRQSYKSSWCLCFSFFFCFNLFNKRFPTLQCISRSYWRIWGHRSLEKGSREISMINFQFHTQTFSDNNHKAIINARDRYRMCSWCMNKVHGNFNPAWD